MIEIEFEEPVTFNCDCCGNRTIRLTRFVYKNDNAHGVYYCQFTNGHEDKVVNGVLSLGNWGDGSTPEDRMAFPFRIWTNEEAYQVGLMDKAECLWNNAEILGTMLDREEGLQHEWIKEVFHITDHIVAEDKIVIEYLNS